MKFESYPHDTQVCSMLVESREFSNLSQLLSTKSAGYNVHNFVFDFFSLDLSLIAVSHTVQDLVFIWNMTDPLVVNDDIELPQQDISKIYTTDCTIEYRYKGFGSTFKGKMTLQKLVRSLSKCCTFMKNA